MFQVVRMTESVRASLPGVQVFEFRGQARRKPGSPAVDFAPEWERLHQRWQGKSKKDVEEFPPHAAYAALYRLIGFDPKKNPPSVQNLIQRFLARPSLDRFPVINPMVDSVNVAAVDSGIPLGVFDDRHVRGDLFLAFTAGGEMFQPLGTPQPQPLPAGVLVLRDDENVLSQFCYRDGDTQKVTPTTAGFRLLGCQAPEITADAVKSALELALLILARHFDVVPATN